MRAWPVTIADVGQLLVKQREDSTSSSQSRSEAVSEELTRQASRRLGIAAWIIGCVMSLYVLLYMTIWAEHALPFARYTGGTLTVLSFAMAIYLRQPRCTAGWLAVTGFAYQIIFCLQIATVEYAALDLDAPANRVSWTCAVILVFPLFVLSNPRHTLWASIVAATMNPVGMLIGLGISGAAWPSGSIVLSLVLPPYLCAVMAYMPARVVARLDADVSRARRLGSYELVEPIGQGGMGEVWRARHRMLVRPAAVKLIKAEALGTDGPVARRLVDRFEREAQVTASLASPHTVELYDFGRADDGTFYYVMELLSGLDLETLVKRFGPLPPERVVFLMLQACDSLDDAHRVGLVHRDIKPANLYVGRKGRHHDFVKVLDFGLVKVEVGALGDGKASETSAGTVQGTPAYLSPEAVTGESKVDRRADIYGLGCVAYWLLTGALVFDEDTPMKMAIAHATRKPEPPSQRSEELISSELDEIVLACLAKDPHDRPDTALELAERLRATELADEWSDERAEQWWETHAPASVAEPEPLASSTDVRPAWADIAELEPAE